MTRPLHLALSALVLLSSSAHATTVPVRQDTWGFTTVTRGVVTKQTIPPAAGRAASLPISKLKTAFLRFNVADTGLNPGTITQARLILYFPTVAKPGALNLHVVTSEWAETFTGPAVPQPGLSPAVLVLSNVVAKQFITVDVTAQVDAWLQNPGTDFGFALTADNGSLTSVFLSAKEGPGSGYPAVLEIETGSSGSISGTAIADGSVTAAKLTPNITLSGTTSGNFSGDGSALTNLSGGQIAANSIGASQLKDEIGLWFAFGSEVYSPNNVGIGTADPTSKLDVQNFEATGYAAQIYNNNNANPAGALGIVHFGSGVGIEVVSAGGSGIRATAQNASAKAVFAVNNLGEAIEGLSAAPEVAATVGRSSSATGYGVRGYVTNQLPSSTDSVGVLGESGFNNNKGVAGRFRNGGAGNGSDVLQVESARSGNHTLLRLSGASGTGATFDSDGNLALKGSIGSVDLPGGVTLNTGAGFLKFRNADNLVVEMQVEQGPLPGFIRYRHAFEIWRSADGTSVGKLELRDLGNSPQVQLFGDGTVFKPGGGSWGVSSDARLKKDVAPLAGALDDLLQLRSVTYEYIDPVAIHERPGQQIGFVAQEVETVFPQWVGEKSDGMKFVAPTGFEALTVQAMRELRSEKDAQLAERDRKIATLEERLAELERRIGK